MLAYIHNNRISDTTTWTSDSGLSHAYVIMITAGLGTTQIDDTGLISQQTSYLISGPVVLSTYGCYHPNQWLIYLYTTKQKVITALLLLISPT